MKKTKEIIVVSLILFILVSIFFWKAATLQELIVTPDININDTFNINYAYKNFLSESLKQKKSFLWTTDINCGYPIHAEGQGGFFYPINLLLFSILPSYIAFNYSIILVFFLTGIFTYLYLRLLNLSKIASIFSAISFMFSGFFVLHVRHLNIIQVASWLPLLFYLIEKYFITNRTIFIILAGVIFGFQILAGHPQIAYYSFIAITFYLLFGIFRKKRLISILLVIFAIGIIGIGLSAMQLIPTIELAKLSGRAISSEIVKGLSDFFPYHFKNLILFLLPFHYGNMIDGTCLLPHQGIIFWENLFYVGIFPLIFMLIGLILIFKKEKHIKIYLFLIIGALLVAMHKVLFLSNIFNNIIPGFKYFRVHQRILLIAVFSICIVAGFGFDYLFKKLSKKIRWLLLFFILIIIWDLFKFGIKQNPTYDINKWLSEPESAELLKFDEDIFRIENLSQNLQQWIFKECKGFTYGMKPYLLTKDFLIPNSNMIYHISTVRGSTILLSKRHIEFNDLGFNEIKVNKNSEKKSVYTSFSFKAAKLFGMRNCKYIISEYLIKSKYLIERNIGKKSFNLYENTQFIPRTYIVPKAKIINDENKILEFIQSDQFNPLKKVILEEDTDFGSNSTEGSEAKITKYENTEVVINTKNTNDGFLVLSDTYYHGWKCFVDDKEEKILRANYLFRAIPLTKGNHVVKYLYKPKSFEIGRNITIITIVLVIASLIFLKRARRQS